MTDTVEEDSVEGTASHGHHGMLHKLKGRLHDLHIGHQSSSAAADENVTQSALEIDPATASGRNTLFEKLHKSVAHLKDEIQTKYYEHQNRFASFVAPCDGNEIKWYVDGCGYFWAVSRALEEALESIWIMDWWLSPELYLRRPPSKNEQYRLDRMLQAAAQRGVKVNIIVYKEVPQALTLASVHTKHSLEALHPNISVFRHPDHVPDRKVFASQLWSSLQNINLTAANATKMPADALEALYGMGEDSVLFWAHHEKLCVVDGEVAFMGGLDLCFGRWDTNQHSISDAHPDDLNRIVFPGQDYNNARIMDFQDVTNFQANKLDRTTNSRMGWTDVSLCVVGPVVEDLKEHFTQRWNFLFREKYDVRHQVRYALLSPAPDGHHHHHLHGAKHRIKERFEGERNLMEGYRLEPHARSVPATAGGVQCQILRSCAKWSHGVPIEHSIADAYIGVIENSEHFVYIENQFFITATTDKQHPIMNKIGAAMVARILRAAREGKKYKIIVNIPAIPGFAGDLRSEDALATRAIMEFQYNSISRGGHSIMESIAREGYNPVDHIRFYNLRNYDRINSSAVMKETERRTGVSYETARKQHDDIVGAGFEGKGEQTAALHGQANLFDQYQRGAAQTRNEGLTGNQNWDSVADCYMLGPVDIRNMPWDTGDVNEIDAFVSEELYIHSKLLIADDRVVICGSANLNDRSQLGYHDSEIAICIQEPPTVESYMNGQPWRVSKFATSLRRQIFRKHLGLLKSQDIESPDENFQTLPIPNAYDWNSPEDRAVMDPLAEGFLNMWNQTARTNTEAFARVFHPVPHDSVRNWKQYGDYYERFFHEDTKRAEKQSIHKWGHVVTENFPPGKEGIKQVKEILSTIKGTLVEMPLLFLIDEDIAREGLGLNAFTEQVYT